MSPKRTIQVMAVLLISSLTFTTCDDGPTGGGGVIPDTTSFPNAVGMLWIYEVYDSLTQNTDTVWVSVTDSGQYPMAPPSLKWRTYWARADTVSDLFAVIRGDTLDFLIDTTFIPKNLERFVFPLSLGAEWVGPYFADTSRVTDIATVIVPAGSFDSSALIVRSWNIDFEGGGSWSETWVTPRVGMVSRYLRSQYSDGQTTFVTLNQIWDLIDYDLTTFSLNQFPNSIGTEWVYEVVDSSTGSNNTTIVTYDTVTVTVDSKVPISWADSAMLWQFIGSQSTDTFFAAVSGNHLKMVVDSAAGPFSTYWYYQFPLAVGREWGIITIVPVPRIDKKEPISTPAGDFPTAFHYTYSGGLLNDYWTIDHWIVPGVGIVKRHYWRFGFGPNFNQYWTLLSYK